MNGKNTLHPTNLSQSEILQRLDRMEQALDAVLDAVGRTAQDQEWLPIRQAAKLAGMSVSALQTRLRRENNRASGERIRRRHGYVHAADWRAYLENQAQAKAGKGTQSKKAAEAAMEALQCRN